MGKWHNPQFTLPPKPPIAYKMFIALQRAREKDTRNHEINFKKPTSEDIRYHHSKIKKINLKNSKQAYI